MNIIGAIIWIISKMSSRRKSEYLDTVINHYKVGVHLPDDYDSFGTYYEVHAKSPCDAVMKLAQGADVYQVVDDKPYCAVRVECVECGGLHDRRHE